MGEDLVKQMDDIARDVQGIIADSFGATASIDRQAAANLDKLKDVLPQYLDFTTRSLQAAQTQAEAFLDPVQGAKFFKMRSNQILEYAALQKELSEAATEEDKERIEAQMRLINAAQQAEISEFEANQVGALSPMQSLQEQMDALFRDIAGINLTEAQITAVGQLTSLWDTLNPTIPGRALDNPGPAVNIGSVVITQLPGENAEQLAERVVRKIEDRLAGRR
jgi:hypothetical protein